MQWTWGVACDYGSNFNLISVEAQAPSPYPPTLVGCATVICIDHASLYRHKYILSNNILQWVRVHASACVSMRYNSRPCASISAHASFSTTGLCCRTNTCAINAWYTYVVTVMNSTMSKTPTKHSTIINSMIIHIVSSCNKWKTTINTTFTLTTTSAAGKSWVSK